MRLISTLCVIFTVLSFCSLTYGQSSAQIKNVERFPARLQFGLKNGHNNIQLSGFEAGQTYSFHAIQPKELEDIIGFAVKFQNGSKVVSSPRKVSTTNKSIQAEIIPADGLVSLDIVLSNSKQEEVLVWITMNCTTCVPNKQWEEDFLAKAAYMAGITTSTGGSPTTLVSGTLIGGNCFDVTGATASGSANNRVGFVLLEVLFIKR